MYCRRTSIFLIVLTFTAEISIVHGHGHEDSSGGGGDAGAGVTGGSILDSLRGFVNELGTVMKDLRNGVDQVANGIQSVEDILDATLDEECVYECAHGHTLHPNPKHVASSNGCGSFGLEKYLTHESVPFLTQFVDCCDEHDLCYGTCTNDKDLCDLKFRKCLYKKCSLNEETLANKLKNKGCKAGAKILYTGTASLGCKPYMDAQREACICKDTVPKSERQKPTKDEF